MAVVLATSNFSLKIFLKLCFELISFQNWNDHFFVQLTWKVELLRWLFSLVHITLEKYVKVKVNDIFDMVLSQVYVGNAVNINLVFDVIMLHYHNL